MMATGKRSVMSADGAGQQGGSLPSISASMLISSGPHGSRPNTSLGGSISAHGRGTPHGSRVGTPTVDSRLFARQSAAELVQQQMMTPTPSQSAPLVIQQTGSSHSGTSGPGRAATMAVSALLFRPTAVIPVGRARRGECIRWRRAETGRRCLFSSALSSEPPRCSQPTRPPPPSAARRPTKQRWSSRRR